MKPGIYPDLPEAEYHAAPGLSNSGIGDLLISPLRYWYRKFDPNREPDEDTAATRLGSALHCAVLESEDTFDARYCQELRLEDYPGALVKADDLKGWLKDHGITPKGTTKAGWSEQIKAVDPDVLIWDDLERAHFAKNAGKVMLKTDEWLRLAGMAQALKAERPVQKILADGRPEVSIFVEEPETGILLKARIDWLAPKYTLDLKTFSTISDRTIKESISNALWYRGYVRQAYFYDLVRRLALKEDHGRADFVECFVESDPPHETLIKRITPKIGSEPNLYWERERVIVRDAIRLYARCMERWGTENPWRDPQDVVDLQDEDLKMLAWS